MTLLLFGLPIMADIALLIAFILLFVSVEKELPLGATITILICAGVMHYLKVIDLSVAPNHLADIGKWAGIWVVIGLIWAVIKWKFYVDAWAREKREYIAIVKSYFLEIKEEKGKTIPEKLKSEWEAWFKAAIEDSYSVSRTSLSSGDKTKLTTSMSEEVRMALYELRGIHKEDHEDLSVRNNKGRITLWGIYWPWSLTWTLIDDPLKRLYQYVLFVWIGGFLQNIASTAKQSVDRDLQS